MVRPHWPRQFLGLLGLLGVLAVGLAGCGSAGHEDSAPVGDECRSLANSEGPDIEAEAYRLLGDRSVSAWADCDSGGYAAVVTGVTHEESIKIVRRMRSLGSVEEVENTECLEHLSSKDCDRTWRYAPRAGERTYTVELPREGAGEFGMAVDH